jgi:hypothetical protein
MKRFFSWQISLIIGLVTASAIIYHVHYLIFHDSRDIFFYTLLDLAFLPLNALIVTFILSKLLTIREKQSKLEKLNMVIGSFFSEAGTELLTYFSDIDPDLDKIRSKLVITNSWKKSDFKALSAKLKKYAYDIDPDKVNFVFLKEFLSRKREFLLRLLENPNLLEHEQFTELLLAVFHLTEELTNRKNGATLLKTDIEHIANDIKRAYIVLVSQWLDYMEHLSVNYPYLFSLAMRINPFDQNSSVEIK